MTSTELRQELLKKIDHLSDQQLNQVLQFVNQVNQTATKSAIDPLADFIGQVDHGNLAQDINQDPLVGLFAGSPDLAEKSEEILAEEVNSHSGWTWK
jgi:hypothetical protein